MLETSKFGALDFKHINKNLIFDLLFYVGLVLIYAIVFARITFGINIPVFFILGLYCFSAIFASKRQLIALLFCCIPLYAAFQFKYAILAGIIIYLIKFGEGVKPKDLWFPFIILMIWEAMHGLVYPFSISEYLRSFCELILLTFIATLPFKKLDFAYICRFFAFACVGIMVVLLFSLLRKNNFDIAEVFSGKYRFGSSETDFSNFSVSFNPNGLGFICNFAMLLLAQLAISKKGKWYDFVLIGILLAFGLMTLSRTFIVCFGIMLILIVITLGTKISIKKTLLISLIAIVGLGVVVLVVYLISPVVITNFIKRFSGGDISNGRIDLFKFYFNGFFASPKNYLVGMGLQDIFDKIPILYGEVNNVPHNGIQEIFVVWGILGFLFFVWYMYDIVRQSVKYNKIKLINLLPFILIFTNAMFGQLITSSISLIAISIAYLSLNANYDADDGVIVSIAEEETEERTFISRVFGIIKKPYKIVVLLNGWGFGWLFSDKLLIKCKYRNVFGKKLDLKNPKTYNEKLQWLKLYDRNKKYSIMVDKFAVKKYVKDKIGEEYVIPTLGVWNNFDEINFKKLPDKFVLKCNHDSGSVIVCRKKSELDCKKAKRLLNRALKRSYYKVHREWPYKNVKPKIFAEKFMVEKDGKELKDYKFFCFNGEVKLLFVARDRFNPNEETKFDFFDENFNHLPFTNGHHNSEPPYEKPENFEKMKELASKLSKGIPQARVDFYNISGKIYFGEITFFHWSGFVKFDPEEWDYKLGEMITLPEINEG